MSQRRTQVPGPGDSKAVKVPSRAHVAVSFKPQVPVAAVCRQCGPKERTGAVGSGKPRFTSCHSVR